MGCEVRVWADALQRGPLDHPRCVDDDRYEYSPKPSTSKRVPGTNSAENCLASLSLRTHTRYWSRVVSYAHAPRCWRRVLTWRAMRFQAGWSGAEEWQQSLEALPVLTFCKHCGGVFRLLLGYDAARPILRKPMASQRALNCWGSLPPSVLRVFYAKSDGACSEVQESNSRAVMPDSKTDLAHCTAAEPELRFGAHDFYSTGGVGESEEVASLPRCEIKHTQPVQSLSEKRVRP
eukprot:1356434-Rhodomonas_salina.2